jgi:hypothetical protein
MLSQNELSNLYQIISKENQTFENISQSFSETFNKCDHLKIAITLCILIKDNLLNLPQRLISFYILFLMKKNDKLDISPFLPFIIEIIQNTKNKIEQNFLNDFLCNQIHYLNTSVKNYIQDNTKTVKINVHYIQMLYEKYNNELNKNGNNKKINDHIRHVLYDRKKSDIKNVDNHPKMDLVDSINIEDELGFKYFDPNYMSFCPMNVNGSNGRNFFDLEPIWIMPCLKHNFIWENEKKVNIKEEDEK